MDLALKARLKMRRLCFAGAPSRKIVALDSFTGAFSARLINAPFPRAALSAETGRLA